MNILLPCSTGEISALYPSKGGCRNENDIASHQNDRDARLLVDDF
jgi:hypothetical protein